jgi:hypothetical protein
VRSLLVRILALKCRIDGEFREKLVQLAFSLEEER